MINSATQQSELQSDKKRAEMAIRLRLKVREVAESRGVNMSQLARRADIGFSTVKRLWKDPYKKTNTELLEKIADALQCSVHDLFEEETDYSPDP